MNINSISPVLPEQASNAANNSVGSGDTPSTENSFSNKMNEVSMRHQSKDKSETPDTAQKKTDKPLNQADQSTTSGLETATQAKKAGLGTETATANVPVNGLPVTELMTGTDTNTGTEATDTTLATDPALITDVTLMKNTATTPALTTTALETAANTTPGAVPTQPSDDLELPSIQNFTFAERNAGDLSEGQLKLIALANENTPMPGIGPSKGEAQLIRGSLNMLRGNSPQQPPMTGVPATQNQSSGLAHTVFSTEPGQMPSDQPIPTAKETPLKTANVQNQGFSQTPAVFTLNTPEAQSLNITPLSADVQTASPINSPLSNSLPSTEMTNKGDLSLKTPVTNPAWTRELGQQIQGMIQNNGQRIALHLNPVELGPLMVELKVIDNQAQVLLTSANLQVRGILESAIPELRESLAEQGINLGETMVGEHRNDQQQQLSGNNKDGSLGDESDEQQALMGEIQGDSRPLDMNGRINLYV
ncbi:MAG: flagellar hook-length control protein FliK [Porticoccus sp.]|nr:flagellar hook-length control protein FliK [Porticoccus sp.]MBQ0807736.1 flagellar hook-length control protein FliK [Porticoccus sp.]